MDTDNNVVKDEGKGWVEGGKWEEWEISTIKKRERETELK